MRGKGGVQIELITSMLQVPLSLEGSEVLSGNRKRNFDHHVIIFSRFLFVEPFHRSEKRWTNAYSFSKARFA